MIYNAWQLRIRQGFTAPGWVFDVHGAMKMRAILPDDCEATFQAELTGDVWVTCSDPALRDDLVQIFGGNYDSRADDWKRGRFLFRIDGDFFTSK